MRCFLGEKPNAELPALYAAADVFVFPSLTDTFGLVLIEAMACGLPVAAFPVPGRAMWWMIRKPVCWMRS